MDATARLEDARSVWKEAEMRFGSNLGAQNSHRQETETRHRTCPNGVEYLKILIQYDAKLSINVNYKQTIEDSQGHQSTPRPIRIE